MHTLPTTSTAASIVAVNPQEEALLALRGLYASMRSRSRQVRRATGFGSGLVWALAEIAARPGAVFTEQAPRH